MLSGIFGCAERLCMYNSFDRTCYSQHATALFRTDTYDTVPTPVSAGRCPTRGSGESGAQKVKQL